MLIAPCNNRPVTCLAYVSGNRFAALSDAGLAQGNSDLLEVRSMMIKSPTSPHNFAARFALRMVLAAALGAGEVVMHGAMIPHTPLHCQDTGSRPATFLNGGGGSLELAPIARGANHADAMTAFIGPGWG